MFSGVRKSFGPNRLAIEFVSPFRPASPTWGSTTKGVLAETVRQREQRPEEVKGTFYRAIASGRNPTNPFHRSVHERECMCISRSPQGAAAQ